MNHPFRSVLLLALLSGGFVGALPAATDYYRLSWRADPSTSMVVGWRQNGGTDTTVHYGTLDEGANYAAYPFSAPAARYSTAKGMKHGFARLAGLQPDTAYYFVVRDSTGVSSRMWFRTAPAVAEDFTFIAGGDSRNNRVPRQNANLLVGKLRPLFVMFGGDYTDGNTSSEWSQWLADWQLTRSADGRMYPIVATRGNHDDNLTVVDIFDAPSSSVYYALPIGGSFMRLYTLNTEATPGGSQGAWLVSDLSAHSAVKWKIAQYHRPMFPHVGSKPENTALYSAWAKSFHDHAMTLVVDSDSHVVKHTWPVLPTGKTSASTAFVRDDATGTVYVGEGCWGAPLRTANDLKPYTRDAGSFNSFHWVQVRADRLELRTINVDNSAAVGSATDSDPFALPAGLNVWNPANGGVVTMYPRANQAPTVGLTAPADGATAVAPASLVLSADAHDADGTVARVDFYAGPTLVGTDYTSPYSIVWSDVAAGDYSLTARATDAEGSTSVSAPRTVSVAPVGTAITHTVTFRQGVNGYSGAKDTKIRSDASTTNYGANTVLEIDGQPDYAALLRFDLSAIPPGKTIVSAALALNVTGASAQPYEIYALRRAWTEGGATWVRASAAEKWASAGAKNTATDYLPAVLGVIEGGSVGPGTFPLNEAGIAQVQAWVDDPATNRGFLIQDYVDNSDGLDFSAKENTTVANRPALTISYR